MFMVRIRNLCDSLSYVVNFKEKMFVFLCFLIYFHHTFPVTFLIAFLMLFLFLLLYSLFLHFYSFVATTNIFSTFNYYMLIYPLHLHASKNLNNDLLLSGNLICIIL